MQACMHMCVCVRACVPAGPCGGLWQVCRIELPLPFLPPPVRGNVPLHILQGAGRNGSSCRRQKQSCGQMLAEKWLACKPAGHAQKEEEIEFMHARYTQRNGTSWVVQPTCIVRCGKASCSSSSTALGLASSRPPTCCSATSYASSILADSGRVAGDKRCEHAGRVAAGRGSQVAWCLARQPPIGNIGQSFSSLM